LTSGEKAAATAAALTPKTAPSSDILLDGLTDPGRVGALDGANRIYDRRKYKANTAPYHNVEGLRILNLALLRTRQFEDSKFPPAHRSFE
jgi:hypothetical protein